MINRFRYQPKYGRRPSLPVGSGSTVGTGLGKVTEWHISDGLPRERTGF